jgi:DNA-binding NarL/FixJ family response regulator
MPVWRWKDHSMTLSVLVVDDDPAFRALAVRILTAAGLKVVGEAGSATAGLAAAMDLKPDAALVDIDLPDGNGVALAHQLKNLPVRPRVLLTSVDGDAVAPEDVRRTGAIAFVHKSELPNSDLPELLSSD